MLDQKWSSSKGGSDNFEFCDLITPNNEIIHVKKYGASSVFSHLFSQAAISADHFQNEKSIVAQVNKHLDGECDCREGCGESYVSLKRPNEEKYKITFAIIYKKVIGKKSEREDGLHMPFFSKVNLRHHTRSLNNKGFLVNLAKISVDQEKQLKSRDFLN